MQDLAPGATKLGGLGGGARLTLDQRKLGILRVPTGTRASSQAQLQAQLLPARRLSSGHWVVVVLCVFFWVEFSSAGPWVLRVDQNKSKAEDSEKMRGRGLLCTGPAWAPLSHM